MPQCFHCKVFVPTLTLLSRHIRNHSLPASQKLKCPEKDCDRGPFSTFTNFAKHYKENHGISCGSEELPGLAPSLNFMRISEDFESEDHEDHSNVEHELAEESLEDFGKSHEECVSSFICKLYADPKIPRNKVQLIVEFTEILYHDTLTRLQNKIKKIVSSDNSHLDELEGLFSVLNGTFKKFSTEYKRLKYFENQGTFIAPVSVPIVYEPKPHSTASAGHYLEMGPRSLQIIPLRQILKSFLEAPGVYKKISEHTATLNSEKDILSDFTQGTLWKETLNKLKSESESSADTLHWPLFLYSDDYETGNALGTHQGDNKLCGVYVTLTVLPPEFRSMMNNIFLFGLFHSNIKKDVPNDVLFRPFLDELMYLCMTGILIETTEYKGFIKFHVGLLLGDNLELHQMTDFIECFTANHPCRLCRVHRDVMIAQLKEDQAQIRTVENYSEDLITNNPSETGINTVSLWNELPHFHVVDNVSVEIMHDCLEGFAVFDVNLILNYAVQNKYVKNISVINQRITAQNYGLIAKKNKPVPVIPVSARKVRVKMSAAEMMNFVTFFGILFGRFFPEGDPVWKLYCLLRQIMDVIFAPFVDKKRLKLLTPLIEEHHQVFLTWNEKRRLKNKQHHLLHYPRLIERFGPLRNFFSFPMEHKHQQGKKVAVSVETSRNVPKTVTIRHQIIHHCYVQSGNVLKDRLELGVPSEITCDTMTFFPNCKNLPPNFPETWEVIPWAKIHGTQYEPQMTLVLPAENDIYVEPEFGEIKAVCVNENNDVAFLCQNLRTLFFDSHVHCYQVEYNAPADYCFLKQSSLTHYLPTNIIKVTSGECFVPYRYAL